MSNGYPANNVYIGARYVPKLVGEWDSTKETAYEPLIIVTYQGNSYTSRQYVPAGIDISNTEYWVLTGNFNGQIESFRLALEAVGDRANTIYMDTVQDMIVSTRLKAGDIVTCFGYYNQGDMPQLSYVISSSGSNSDGGSTLALNNGLFANAIFGGTVYPEWYGIDNSHNNWDAYMAFIESHNVDYAFMAKTYTLPRPLVTHKSIIGSNNGKKRTVLQASTKFAKLSGTTYFGVDLSQFSSVVCFRNLTRADEKSNPIITNIEIQCESNDCGLLIADGVNLTVDSLLIEGSAIVGLSTVFCYISKISNVNVIPAGGYGFFYGGYPNYSGPSGTTTLTVTACGIEDNNNVAKIGHYISGNTVTLIGCYADHIKTVEAKAFFINGRSITLIDCSTEDFIGNDYYTCPYYVTDGNVIIINPFISEDVECNMLISGSGSPYIMIMGGRTNDKPLCYFGDTFTGTFIADTPSGNSEIFTSNAPNMKSIAITPTGVFKKVGTAFKEYQISS